MKTWMVRRMRLQPSIQATSSLRSMYSGTVLDQGNWGASRKEKGKTVCCSEKKGKLPVFLQEFLWTENCERLLKLLYVEHNHSVYELIRMRDITRLRSESFQWIIQEGRAWPPPTDENMFRYARTRVSKTRNQLSFGVCHLEQVIDKLPFWVVNNGLSLDPADYLNCDGINKLHWKTTT